MMMRIITAAAVVLLAATVAARNSNKTWDFDSGKAGGLPSGFTVFAGEWKVVADDTAISRPNVLAQLAKNSGSTFNLVLVDSDRYKDVDLSVSMKAVAGKEDQGGGLVWRAKDGDNYYVARFNPLEDNFNLYKVENGRRTQIKGATIKERPGWHALRANMTGNRIECYFDGKKVLEATDSTFAEAGRIGLWTKADAQTHFDDLTVSGG